MERGLEVCGALPGRLQRRQKQNEENLRVKRKGRTMNAVEINEEICNQIKRMKNARPKKEMTRDEKYNSEAIYQDARNAVLCLCLKAFEAGMRFSDDTNRACQS